MRWRARRADLGARRCAHDRARPGRFRLNNGPRLWRSKRAEVWSSDTIGVHDSSERVVGASTRANASAGLPTAPLEP